MDISIIVARSKNNVIGGNNTLLWHLPADLKFFKEKTLGRHIIMGRKTYDSIGRPLPGRKTIIVSRQKDYQVEGCQVRNSLLEAIDLARSSGESEVIICGGGEIYQEALLLANRLYLTEVDLVIEGDTFFKHDLSAWKVIQQEYHLIDDKNTLNYSFDIYERLR